VLRKNNIASILETAVFTWKGVWEWQSFKRIHEFRHLILIVYDFFLFFITGLEENPFFPLFNMSSGG
jgi:hypothetical protein